MSRWPGAIFVSFRKVSELKNKSVVSTSFCDARAVLRHFHFSDSEGHNFTWSAMILTDLHLVLRDKKHKQQPSEFGLKRGSLEGCLS